jgi:hypothetical protein
MRKDFMRICSPCVAVLDQAGRVVARGDARRAVTCRSTPTDTQDADAGWSVSCPRNGHARWLRGASWPEDECWTPAAHYDDSQRKRDRCGSDRGEDAEAQLDHRAHPRIVLHARRQPAVVSSDRACQCDHGRDHRQVAAVSPQHSPDR